MRQRMAGIACALLLAVSGDLAGGTAAGSKPGGNDACPVTNAPERGSVRTPRIMTQSRGM